MSVENWAEAPEIHPSQVCIGDVIGTLRETPVRYRVTMIGVPHSAPRRWTFFGRDDSGNDYAKGFGEDDRVRRYRKAV